MPHLSINYNDEMEKNHPRKQQPASQCQSMNVEDAVERILNMAERRQASQAAASTSVFDSLQIIGGSNNDENTDNSGGPFTCQEISHLAMICTASVSYHHNSQNKEENTKKRNIPQDKSSKERDGVWSEIDVDTLANLASMLETHVESAGNVHLIHQSLQAEMDGEDVEQWLLSSQRLTTIQNGLEASSILLCIMITPNLSRPVVSEDAVVGCIGLFRQHLLKNILPVLSSFTLSPEEHQAVLQKLHKPTLTTVGFLSNLMEKMEWLISSSDMFQLNDELLLSVSGAALSMLSVTPETINMSICNLIQVSCISLVTAVFSRYPRHRTIILEDLFPILIKLPSSKRSLRTFPISNTLSIQLFTYALHSMIQSTVTMPTLTPENTLTSGLVQARFLCDMFTAQILKRCSRKGEDGGSSEYRPIFLHLVEDLLNIRLLPEYPASEILLMSFSRGITSELLRISSSTSKTLDQPTYLTTLIDTLGIITSSIVSNLRSHRDSPLRLPSKINSQITQDPSQSNNRCFCNRPSFTETFMLDCDRCHGWFHGSCVGITKNNLPQVWLCDECTIQIWVMEQTQEFCRKMRIPSDKVLDMLEENEGMMKLISPVKKNPKQKDQGDIVVEDTHIFRQLLLHHLTLRQKKQSSYNKKCFAREFHLAKWLEELSSDMDKEQNVNSDKSFCQLARAQFMEQWDMNQTMQERQVELREQGGDDKVFRRELSVEGMRLLVQNLAATSSELSLAFPHLLGLLVKMMGDDNVSVRKLAVKGIAKVIQSDALLMLQPQIRKSISRRFYDPSISVREATISLVGSYILNDPSTFAETYHLPLIARLSDVGVSVRKRTVRIFQQVLLKYSAYKKRAEVMIKMLNQAADPKEDDGVRDLIHETFQLLWFAYHPPSPTEKEGSRKIESSQPPFMQIVEVILYSPTDKTNLTTLIREMLFGLGGGNSNGSGRKEKKKALTKVQTEQRAQSANWSSSKIISSIMEEVLSLEERRRKRIPEEQSGKMLVALLATLEVFSDAAPDLLLPHVETLLIYIKGDNCVSREEESQMMVSLTKILSKIKFTTIDRVTKNGSLCDDLMKITYKFGSEPLASAVSALSNLAKDKEAGKNAQEKLMTLAKQFYTFLFKNKDNAISSLSQSAKSNTHRSLSVLGAICRYHQSAAPIYNQTDDNRIAAPASITAENLSKNCFALFLLLLEANDTATKCASFKALTGIFLCYPRILLDSGPILEQVISQKSEPELILTVLQCWRDILLSEELRIESGDAKSQMEADSSISISERIGGDQDGDSCLAGGVLTQQSQRLFILTASPDPSLRYATVELLGHLLRQGLVNPMETVPYLLALQGDVESSEVRQLALKLLILEGEKRPDMLRQRVCAGVQKAFWFQTKVLNKKSTGSAFVTAVITTNIPSDKPNKMKSSAECIFGPIFKVLKSQLQRKGLFKSLLSLFAGAGELKDEEDSKAVITHVSAGNKRKRPSIDKISFLERLPLLSYATQILAHLPYETVFDPLFIIYHISCVTAVQGNYALEALHKFLRSHNLTSMRDEEENLHPDELEAAAANTDTLEVTKEQMRSRINKLDMVKFAEMCAEASALTLLLRLKLFLRKIYGLSETRCMEYSPSTKEKVSATSGGLVSEQEMPIFNHAIGESTILRKNDSNVHDIDALIRQYAEFRLLMRSTDVGMEKLILNGNNGNGWKRRKKSRAVA